MSAPGTGRGYPIGEESLLADPDSCPADGDHFKLKLVGHSTPHDRAKSIREKMKILNEEMQVLNKEMGILNKELKLVDHSSHRQPNPRDDHRGQSSNEKMKILNQEIHTLNEELNALNKELEALNKRRIG